MVSKNEEKKLDVEFQINFGNKKKSVTTHQVTRSGRTVRQRITTTVETEEVVHSVDYEDELDILVILSSSSQSGVAKGKIGLYDNQSGCLLRSIAIENWDENDIWSVYMERDIIVCLCKSLSYSSRYLCLMYKLRELVC